MELPAYLRFVADRVEEKHVSGDRDEVVRLSTLLRDTLAEKVAEWTSAEAASRESAAADLWLRFLHSFALSDHIGDGMDAVRGYAQKSGLPMPPENANLEDWTAWVEARGCTRGIHGE